MIRVLVIEDHLVTISGLRNFFRPGRDKINIVSSSDSIKNAFQVKPENFDVVLLDLWLPEGKPMENFLMLQEKFPEKPIIIFTSEHELNWQRKMFKAGAKGFINKKYDRHLMFDIIEKVMKGETVYTPEMIDYKSSRVINVYNDPKFHLSEDQQNIIKYLLDGLTTNEIAEKISKSEDTVYKNLKNIRKNFQVKSNIELIKTLFQRNDFH
ncbi:MAG: response regulator transcription factor [Bacteroidota bacterium]|nr:response regulator transcription factor [Bacteroidota bacterium]